MTLPFNGLICEGQSDFEVTPTQIYWLDDDIDREYKRYDQVHGTIILKYEVQGNLDMEVFKKSISFLVCRHESLRATFHKKVTAFVMKVESPDNRVYEPEFIRDPPCDEDHYETLSNFKGHKFDVENGPLFLSRVIRRKPDLHVIAFKIHHVIFDDWSLRVLTKELFLSYGAFASGRNPPLPEPKFQYKDYLALISKSLKANYEADRKYWSGKYSQLPPRLRIPGMKLSDVPMTERVIKKEVAFLPDGILDRVVLLSRKYGVSLFVILQAAFKYYLLKETGQRDILIGTYAFGRDYPGCDDQIGCYAKTVLIRTVLETDDSFPTCISKVERSNHDMRTRTGYPLRYFLEELLPVGSRSGDFYWNINLQFIDERIGEEPEAGDAALKNGPSVRLLPNYYGNTLIQMDMELAFVHLRDRMQLVVHYDGASFALEAISRLISSFSTFAGELTRKYTLQSSL